MKRNDIRIMGEGTLGAGSYGNVKISGEGRVSGEIDAIEMHVMGNVTAEKDIKLEKLKVSGSGKFSAVSADELRVSGNADFKGLLSVKSMDIMGEVRAFNGVKAQRIKVRGSIEDKKSVETEQFESYGAIDLASLNADTVDIKLYGHNRANEIVGGTVNVIYPLFKKIFLGMFFFRRNWARLTAENIEADRIYIERTTAGSVKGNDVSIGPGCRIKIVEYRDKILIDKGSVVEQQIKI